MTKAQEKIQYICGVCNSKWSEEFDADDCCTEETIERQMWECSDCNTEYLKEHDANECCADQMLNLKIAASAGGKS